MPKKALYLCCIAEPWISVAKQLEAQNIVPVYFVHWKGDAGLFSESFKGKSHLQTLENAWKGIGFPEGLKPKALDEIEFKEIAWFELNALKMMDRLDPLGNEFGFQERRYFFQDLVGYWLAYIEKYGLDVVISPSIPHRVFDYALYVSCKLKKIRFLMLQMVPFGSTSVVIEDIDSMGEEYQFDLSGEKGRKPSPNILEKIEKVKADYSVAIPDYMVSHKNNNKLTFSKLVNTSLKPLAKIILSHVGYKKRPNTYWVKRGEMPTASCYSWLDFQVTELKRALKVRSMRRQYEKLAISSIPEKFVLFALHYQPEETSCPTGGSYADQISLLRVLDEVFPEEVTIVVKEHKSQFYTHQESASGRDRSFYQRLSQVSNRVLFASVDATPFELIDKAIATVTISGTIGWESAIRGTPVLVFGRAWYESMPRVHKVKSKSDIISVLPKLNDEKNSDLESLILDFHYQLEKKIVWAKHYKAFLDNEDVSLNKSVGNLAGALSSMLLS
jgi:hypothetical protein